MSLLAIAFSLFFILNAIGSVPLFLAILGRYDIKRQRRIIFRELLIALFILLMFNYFGQQILKLLGISQPIIGIAGGILLFLIALGMIFPKMNHAEMPKHEPMIVPLAIPLIAGPGGITTVMVFAEQVRNPYIMTGAIFLAWIPTILILLAASNIKYFLGEKGVIACERLGGMLLSLIAVQMFSNGAIKLIQNSFPGSL